MKIRSDSGTKSNLRGKETLLLIVVFAGLLIAVLYMMVYTPLQEETVALKDQMQTLDAELTAKTTRAQLLPSLRKELSLLGQGGAELYNLFYGMVDQEEFIFVLHRYAQESGISLDRVAFESEKADLPQEFTAQPEEEGQSAPDGANTGNEGEETPPDYLHTVKMTTLALDISGEYEQCIQFLNLLHINERKIAVADALFESLGEKGTSEETVSTTPLTTPVRGTVALVIFHVPEADNIHQARDERKVSGEAWIVGTEDPFDASVVAGAQTPPPQ